MMKRLGYLKEFLEFWTPRPEVRRVWFSLFTPQIGHQYPEVLEPHERRGAIADISALRQTFSKLDMPAALVRQFAAPPGSPANCVFALTTETLSADLKTRITPCQFGGNPDCKQCGWVASMGLSAIAAHKFAGILSIGAIFKASINIGRWANWSAEKECSLGELRILP